ncbi:MAG: DEAD/DEAH box helicase family protein [Chloroflexi bacterium]|nr:DEAD/DEAH box helicase family protein [Chloroflexota bacterium]
MTTSAQMPIQPVENPILCSPYGEPQEHWLYDTNTGLPTRMDGRREASYWFKSQRTGSAQQTLLAEEERDDLPLVNSLRADVRRWREAGWPNASATTKKLLRHWWREDRQRRLFFCQLEAVETVLYLQEILSLGRRTRWKPQLTRTDFDALTRGENPRPGEWVARVAQHPKLADIPNEKGLEAIRRYACKMATGSGKTVVMAMLIAWAFCNRGTKPGDPRYPRRALVVCPNLTIRERLAVLLPSDRENYYEKFDLVPPSLRPELAKGKVLVTNWHLLQPQAPELRVGGLEVGNLGEETPNAFARARLGELWADEPLMVLNDEGHHAYRPAPVGKRLSAEEKAEREQATVWVSGLDRIHSACGIGLCVDLSATPFYIQGSGYPEGSPFPWIVSDFGLVDAIESGITKIPRLPAMDNTGRPDPQYFRLWDHVTKNLTSGDRLPGRKPKPEVVYRKAEDALLTLAGQWRERFQEMQRVTPGQERTPPVMIIVCDNTDIAKHFHRMISGEEMVKEEANGESRGAQGRGEGARTKKKTKLVKAYTAGLQGFEEVWNRPDEEVAIRIDSKLLADAESGSEKATRKQAADKLRRIVSTVGKQGEPGERIRCVVSVNMLSEGWDANNVTQILGLRAFHSQLLCEQVVGRGLRRMDYTPDPVTGLLTAEYVDIFGVPFSLIPFKGRQPGRSTVEDDRPKHEVMALPARKALEIRFPVVEGYVTVLNRRRIACDVPSVERIRLDPLTTPTATFIRPEVAYKVGSPSAYAGFEPTEVTREQYYDSVHPQMIGFAIAEAITRELTEASHVGKEQLRSECRQVLFPQVFRVVQEYIEKRVDLNGMDPRDIGLQIYAQRVVGLLVSAITPDTGAGELPELPRLQRYKPMGGTEGVHFKTTKPVRATTASHLNYVACDTGSWEQAAMFQLERLANEAVIRCYARNEGLEFSIPYETDGRSANYEPDFIVQFNDGSHVVVEVKGYDRDGTSAKHEAAKRWARAISHWRQMGDWEFLVCREPQDLGTQLRQLFSERMARFRAEVERVEIEVTGREHRLPNQ